MKDSNKNLKKEVVNAKNENKIILEKGETSKSKQIKSPRIIRKYKTRKSKKLEDEKIAEEIALGILKIYKLNYLLNFYFIMQRCLIASLVRII